MIMINLHRTGRGSRGHSARMLQHGPLSSMLHSHYRSVSISASSQQFFLSSMPSSDHRSGRQAKIRSRREITFLNSSGIPVNVRLMLWFGKIRKIGWVHGRGRRPQKRCLRDVEAASPIMVLVVACVRARFINTRNPYVAKRSPHRTASTMLAHSQGCSPCSELDLVVALLFALWHFISENQICLSNQSRNARVAIDSTPNRNLLYRFRFRHTLNSCAAFWFRFRTIYVHNRICRDLPTQCPNFSVQTHGWLTVPGVPSNN